MALSMMYALSRIVWTVIEPSTLLLVVALAGAIGLVWRRRSNLALLLIWVGLGGLTLCTVLPVGAWLMRPLERRFPAMPDLPEHVDGIILLGGFLDLEQSSALGRPVLDEAAGRIPTFVALARHYPQAALVFTGGDPGLFGSGTTEAAVTWQLFEQLGLASERIRYEDRSRNTHENAVYSQALVKPAPRQQWVLVTSAVDMPRAVGCFRAAGWPVIPYPTDYHTAGIALFPGLRDGFMTVDWATHEWIGLVYYRLRGWIPSLFPGPQEHAVLAVVK
ncbi:MAG: YdcF family protein [Candidatus Acidiferrales bacterium]